MFRVLRQRMTTWSPRVTIAAGSGRATEFARSETTHLRNKQDDEDPPRIPPEIIGKEREAQCCQDHPQQQIPFGAPNEFTPTSPVGFANRVHGFSLHFPLRNVGSGAMLAPASPPSSLLAAPHLRNGPTPRVARRRCHRPPPSPASHRRGGRGGPRSDMGPSLLAGEPSATTRRLSPRRPRSTGWSGGRQTRPRRRWPRPCPRPTPWARPGSRWPARSARCACLARSVAPGR